MPVDETSIVGRRVAKYLIESLLGEGAMGRIYRARHIDFDQVVALKVLRRDLASVPSFVERFHREAKAAFQIDHPNIVRVIDFGTASDDVPYLAMELLEGRSLATILFEERPIANGRIVHLMRQSLAGVAAAHAVGIVHRDLKPENIMVTHVTNDEGTPTELVKVCDFGIAKLTRDDPYAELRAGGPLNGLLAGTPEYMAPEYAGGDPIDPRADVYAMGVVLYELLTGRVPFSAGSAVATVYKAMSTIPPPPSSIAKVHPQLEAICLRALEKDPDKRFASARAMRAALGEVLDTIGDSGRSPSASRPSIASVIPRPESLAAHALQTARVNDARPSTLRSGAVVGFLGLSVFAIGVAIADRNHDHGQMTAALSGPMGERSIVAKAMSPGTIDDVRASPLRTDAISPMPRAARMAGGGKVQGVFRSESAMQLSDASTPTLQAIDLPSAPHLASEAAPNVESSPVVSTLVASIGTASQGSAAAPVSTRVDPSRARAHIAGIANEGGVLRKNVHIAMVRILPQFTACYRAALQAATFSGNAVLHLETDTAGVVVRARASMRFAPTISTCVEHAARGITLADVDTGDAEADVTLRFDIAP